MSRAIQILLVLAVLACVLIFVVPHGGHEILLHDSSRQDQPAEKGPGKGEAINVDDLGGAVEDAASSSNGAGVLRWLDQSGNTNKKVASKQNANDDQHDDHHFHRTSHFNSSLAPVLKQPLLPPAILRLYSGSVMPLFTPPEKLSGLAAQLRETAESYRRKRDEEEPPRNPSNNYGIHRPSGLDGEEINALCDWGEKESSSNVAFALEFSRILRDRFPPERGGALDGSGLHWFLDEGGLIGSSRAGALRNADDDFDFFLLLPHLHAICRPDSLTCTADEFNRYIHSFLMVFHNEGMCINKFSPDPKRFKSRSRLMYSFQLNRGQGTDPEKCFRESKPFAHMHLGIFNEKGEVCTNVWIPAHSTHAKDRLHLDDMLPVTRCRAGPVDVPCPQNITGFLTVRNRGEYRKRSADGSCLVVKKKWSEGRKKRQAETLEALDKCGYNSIVDLLPAFKESGYKNC